MTEVIEATEDFEPTAYFEQLKSMLSEVHMTELESQIEALIDQIVMAKSLGQKNMLHKLSFVYQTILREKVLLVNDIRNYVYKDDIVKYIENVKPKNSVKIIELERFPRVIPEENAEVILKYKDYFDGICIIFTDFTENTYESETDKKIVQRNRDPIAFGYFNNEKANLRHDRFYFITDWVDEYCDLTLTKLVEELGKLGVKKPLKEISDSSATHINAIVTEALKEAEQLAIVNNRILVSQKSDNFIARFIHKLFPNNV